MVEEMVLDDFSAAAQRSADVGQWEGFTDQVMGGQSEMQAGLREEEGLRFLRMEGRVSLENNGGFIQVRLPLTARSGGFNGAAFRGVRIRYRTAAKGSYYLHLRTTRTRLPWAHYAAPLPSSPEWDEAFVPWEDFDPQLTILRRPAVHQLTSIAVVAAKKAGEARIDIRSIGLY
jgi:hypothetical protein